MPRGLKQTSAPLVISFSTDELVVNTFQQEQVSMQLNVLDREVMVVTGINIDVEPPNGIAGVDTITLASLSATSRTSVGSLADTNVLAVSRDSITSSGYVDNGVAFTQSFGETPSAGMDYLQIISTNDFFIQVQGEGNLTPKGMQGKLFCYRAVADADVFAALVQSELLSA
ncbi:MAG TPA: hypothetical protein HPP54_10815 [Nitrospinae bacterium]|nr:hypothetical protein [Nitrospinota bacterium]